MSIPIRIQRPRIVPPSAPLLRRQASPVDTLRLCRTSEGIPRRYVQSLVLGILLRVRLLPSQPFAKHRLLTLCVGRHIGGCPSTVRVISITSCPFRHRSFLQTPRVCTIVWRRQNSGLAACSCWIDASAAAISASACRLATSHGGIPLS